MKKVNIFANITVKKRLALIAWTVFFPMLALVILVVLNSVNSAAAYNQIIKNVTYANQYSKEFKQRLDYSVYLAVVEGKQISESRSTKTVNGIVTVNPYSYIEELMEVCDRLSAIATLDINKNQVVRLKRSLNSLRNNIETLDYRLKEKETYQDNLEYLNWNIYNLSSIIEEGITEYVYLETSNLETVRSLLEDRLKRQIQLTMGVVVSIALLAIVLSKSAEKSITLPLEELVRVTGKIGQGKFKVEKSSNSDEIAVLNNSFSTMAEQIEGLLESVKDEQRSLRFTENKLLQAQINPHFLYNTLDTIVWMAEEKNTKDVVQIVTALSSFFRSTLSEGRDYITVREEKEHIESYLKIQKLRYQDILEYEIFIDEQLSDCTIPKLLLQPLVENALYHGIKNKRGLGKITIEGKRLEECIYFQVSDNGIGMKKEELKELEEKTESWNAKNSRGGFGLANVNMRIKHYYGEQYGISFDSVYNEGTRVRLTLSYSDREACIENLDKGY